MINIFILQKFLTFNLKGVVSTKKLTTDNTVVSSYEKNEKEFIIF